MKRNRQDLLATHSMAWRTAAAGAQGYMAGISLKEKRERESYANRHVPKISCSSMGSSASELSDTDLLSKPSKVSWRTFSQWGGLGEKVVRSSSGRRRLCFCLLRVGSSERLRMVGLAFWSSAMVADVET